LAYGGSGLQPVHFHWPATPAQAHTALGDRTRRHQYDLFTETHKPRYFSAIALDFFAFQTRLQTGQQGATYLDHDALRPI
jgi:hypothetical protein